LINWATNGAFIKSDWTKWTFSLIGLSIRFCGLHLIILFPVTNKFINLHWITWPFIKKKGNIFFILEATLIPNTLFSCISDQTVYGISNFADISFVSSLNDCKLEISVTRFQVMIIFMLENQIHHMLLLILSSVNFKCFLYSSPHESITF